MWRGVAVLCGSAFLLTAAGDAATPDTQLLEQALEAGSGGDPKRAAELAQQAVEACGDGEAGTACRLTAYTLLSRSFALRSHYDLALEQARKAVAIAATSSRESQLSTWLIAAGAAARANELEEAEVAIASGEALADELAEGLSPEDAHKMRLLRGMFGGPQALVYAARGEWIRAASAQEIRVKTIRAFDVDHPNLAAELMTLADFQEEASNLAGARESYAEAVALAQRHHDIDLRDKARAALVRLDASGKP